MFRAPKSKKGLALIRWVPRKEYAIPEEKFQSLVTQQEDLLQGLDEWQPSLVRTKGKGATGPQKIGLLVEFAQQGLRGFTLFWRGPQFKLTIDLKTFKSPQFQTDLDPCEIHLLLNPDMLPIMPSSMVSQWKQITDLVDISEMEVSDPAVKEMKLEDIVIRAKVYRNPATKKDNPFRIRVQCFLDPSKVTNVDRINSSFVKAGALTELPAMMYNYDRAASDPYMMDLLPGMQVDAGASPSEMEYRLAVHFAMSAMAGGGSVGDPQQMQSWAHVDVPVLVFAEMMFSAPLQENLKRPREGRTLFDSKNSLPRYERFHRDGKNQPNLLLTSKYQVSVELAGCGEALPTHFSQREKDLVAEVLTASVTRKTQRRLVSDRKRIVRLCDRDVFLVPRQGDALLIAIRTVEAGGSHNSARHLVGSYETLMRLEGYEMQGWSPILKKFLAGINNLKKDAFKEAEKTGRLPVTASLLVSIRGTLDSLPWSQYRKTVFWAVLSVLFWGSLRCNEILCQEVRSFNISQSFLESDIRVDERGIVLLWLRDTKAGPVAGDVVELHPCRTLQLLDPIEALTEYWQLRNNIFGSDMVEPPRRPFFVQESGNNMTRAIFTQNLRTAIAAVPGFTKKDALLYGGHSPRSGLPSLVQEMNLDEEVYKKFGRWSSSAYQLYLKDQEAMRKGREAVAVRCQSLAWALTASE